MLLNQAAHALKGSSASLGLRQVTEICEKLEHLSLDGSSQKAEALTELLDYEIARARELLRAERQRRLLA